jgi:hypothetical protein
MFKTRDPISPLSLAKEGQEVDFLVDEGVVFRRNDET